MLVHVFEQVLARVDAVGRVDSGGSAFEREFARFLAGLPAAAPASPRPGPVASPRAGQPGPDEPRALTPPRPAHPWTHWLTRTPVAGRVNGAAGAAGHDERHDDPQGRPPADGPEVGPRETALAEIGRAADQGAAHLQVARGAHRAAARAAAEQAEALAAFAACRPSSLDLPDGAVGAAAAATRAARPAVLTPVSEWAADEVAVALRLDRTAATSLLAESLVLVQRLPATLQALRAGELGWRHAQVMIALIGPMADQVRAVAEEQLLRRLGSKTSTQLRAAARRVVQRLDPDALAERMAAAIRSRRVALFPGEDGMSSLYALLPGPVARACHSALEQYAQACVVPGDTRTKDQRMADCLVDLLLRPGEHGLAPVQAHLTIVASVRTLLGGDDPGEVGGDLVPALMVRELAYALGLLPRPVARDDGAPPRTPSGVHPEPDQDINPDIDPWPDRATPRTTATTARTATTDEETVGAGEPSPAGRRGDGMVPADDVRLLGALIGTDRLDGTALARRPHIAVVDELSGQLLALTNATELRRAAWCGRPDCRTGRCTHLDGGTGLGPPPESPGYRPGEQLDRFVRLRDRRCRFPGCRARPIRCDADHTVPWPRGATSHDNLCCLCRHHHRLSHQAPGWQLAPLPDGGLRWTTPSGLSAVTHPPRYGADDDLPLREPTASDRRSTPADDPPPF